MVFANAVCVNVTPTTQAVRVTALWTQRHAWPQTDRSAMAEAYVSAAPASAQIPSFRGQLVRCVRPASVSVLNISKFRIVDTYCLLPYVLSLNLQEYLQ